MNSCLMMPAFLVVCTLLFHVTSSESFANPRVRVLGTNPHTENGDCGLCHLAPVEKLRGAFVFDSTKRRLTEDPVTVCKKCHGETFGHGVGKRPALNRADLPLNSDGTINCALTCHDMHVNGVKNHVQQRFHLRVTKRKLCLSCHDK